MCLCKLPKKTPRSLNIVCLVFCCLEKNYGDTLIHFVLLLLLLFAFSVSCVLFCLKKNHGDKLFRFNLLLLLLFAFFSVCLQCVDF